MRRAKVSEPLGDKQTFAKSFKAWVAGGKGTAHPGNKVVDEIPHVAIAGSFI